MEIKVKIESGCCDYTGASGEAFVKLIDSHGQETGWFGQEALDKANRMLLAVGGQAVAPVENLLAHPPGGYPSMKSDAEAQPSQSFRNVVKGMPKQPVPEGLEAKGMPHQTEPQTLREIGEELKDIPGISTQGLDQEIEYGAAPTRHVPQADKKKDATLITLVREDLIELAGRYAEGDPENNRKPGIPEMEIRNLMSRYSHRFANKGNLFKELNSVTGMTRDRFDVLLSNSKTMKTYKTYLERNRE